MKKLFCSLVAAGMVLALVSLSPAAEFKASGSAEMVFEAAGNFGVFEQGRYAFQDTADVWRNYNEPYHGKHSRAIQRFILQFDFTASENLSAHYDAIAGFFTWGGPATGAGPAVGGAIGTRAVNFTTRQAYLDWAVPHTRVKLRMGLQMWPMQTFATGVLSPTGDEFGTGILATAPLTGNITLTAAWIRGVSDLRRGNVNTGAAVDDNVDIFLATLPVSLDGARFTPWAAFGVHGEDSAAIAPVNSYTALSTINVTDDQSADNTTAGYMDINNQLLAAGKRGLAAVGNGTSLFLGFGGEITRFDPWRFALDAQYSAFETRGEVRDRSGWMAGAAVDYKTSHGVPGLRAWYASGDDRNPLNGSERPISFAGAGLGGAAGAHNVFGSGLGGNMMLSIKAAAAGTWGVALQWTGASFVPNLSHNFHVAYIQGTNHRDMARYANPRFVQTYLTTEDSLVAVNLESLYKIYANLHYIFELTYIFENLDGDVWARGIAPGSYRTAGVEKLHFSNAWRVGMNFRYLF
jgi:hypothetical protein